MWSCRGRALVMLDGCILGVHQNPARFVTAMRRLRRAGKARHAVPDAEPDHWIMQGHCQLSLHADLYLGLS